ncbi:SHOCT domain-containing protein [Planctomicrobium piriforme]|uniref:Short C-terminal domain-containing protein n=1 Tax=Planctomicrobium piriforme TaxID=1576369 RepID=A0A1I3D9F4_9PLAN|nr:SHOCT domain-containing protein [Planctomicrobium piriforme]SFH83141.1 Short C-terminal domain-containing protein [Planctomicrobium piriforme]
MRQLTAAGNKAIDDLAERHGFSRDAVQHMLEAVVNGNGSMAQFNHYEFGGSGQWMWGGMTMLSDMFNHGLKSRVDGLCNELSRLVADGTMQTAPMSSQSQSQSGSGGFGNSQSQYSGSGSFGNQNSLFVPQQGYGNWWPDDLGSPSSTGSQNHIRYAYFANSHRLAIELGGKVTVYDTLNHQIYGFSQQQSGDSSLTFTSQNGVVSVSSLPVISGGDKPAFEPAPQYSTSQSSASNSFVESPTPQTTPKWEAAPMAVNDQSSNGSDVFAALERLGALRDKNILTEDEFATKKAELLKRL